ncbi:hypothetical protein M5K25_009867 [Dendrobium thyrsiflorum]|uniref:NB-ARC domain-containing protein n=1 Tax=Dendrobium thyrsiflorum TaxID=117978 RepID=A0ABD0V784_DENTH
MGSASPAEETVVGVGRWRRQKGRRDVQQASGLVVLKRWRRMQADDWTWSEMQVWLIGAGGGVGCRPTAGLGRRCGCRQMNQNECSCSIVLGAISFRVVALELGFVWLPLSLSGTFLPCFMSSPGFKVVILAGFTLNPATKQPFVSLLCAFLIINVQSSGAPPLPLAGLASWQIAHGICDRVGLGGFKDVMTKKFDLEMLVSVSNNFDVRRVIVGMLESLKIKRPDLESFDALQGSLKSKVLYMTLLLVLDDIWEEEEKQNKSK